MSSNDRRTLSAEEKEEFAYELALGYFKADEMQQRFELRPSAYQSYADSDEIKRLVLIKHREIDESDQAIRIHARRAARVAITQLAMLVEDEEAPAKTRMDAARQLREYATVVDKEAIAESGDGAIYIKTNLDLGNANGVYAITARDVDEQMDDPDREDSPELEAGEDESSRSGIDDDFADLIYG